MIKNEIINLIKDKRARIAVIGLGYVAGEEWTRLSSVLHSTWVIVAILVILALGSVLVARRRQGS